MSVWNKREKYVVVITSPLQASEDLVLDLLKQTNRPFSVQTVTDHLQTKGVKKAACQRALDNLSNDGKIIAKEFGKTKIFHAVQQGRPVLSSTDQQALKHEIETLRQDVKAQDDQLRAVQGELTQRKNQLTVVQMTEQIAALEKETTELKKKRESIIGTGEKKVKVVTPEEKEKVVKDLEKYVDGWRKRKSIFKNIWDLVSEEMDPKIVKKNIENMGVETDEQMKQVLADFIALVDQGRNKGGKRALAVAPQLVSKKNKIDK